MRHIIAIECRQNHFRDNRHSKPLAQPIIQHFLRKTCAGCSSILRHSSGPPIVIDSNISQYGLSHFDANLISAFAHAALRINSHIDGNRGSPYFDDVGIKADQIADKHRLLEYKGINGNCCNSPACASNCRDTASDIDLRHNPSAENIAGIVGVRRHRHHTQYGLSIRQGNVQ